MYTVACNDLSFAVGFFRSQLKAYHISEVVTFIHLLGEI